MGSHALGLPGDVDGVRRGERVHSDATLIAAAMSDSSEPAGMASSTRPTSARMGSVAPAAGS